LIQLPYALDLIKSSLEAGHTLQRGMQVVEQEFADPLGGEFRTVVEQTRLGLPITHALADMLARVPEDDLRLFVVAVKVQSGRGQFASADHRAAFRHRAHAPAPVLADSRAHRAIPDERDGGGITAPRKCCFSTTPANSF
jgi:hypothetical protein